MPELNANVPGFECLVRAEHLYNLERGFGDFRVGFLFGVASVQGRALGFHVLTEDGACVWRLPISALCWKECRKRDHDRLELWDCFSPQVTVTEFEHLVGRRCQTTLRDGERLEGECLFTIDWHGNEYADNPGDSGHKCAHFLKLDDGCFAAQPNNRILWADPATITEPFARVPDYVTNTHVFRCEHDRKWVTEDSDRAHYSVKEL